ncbi:MAG: DUF4097 family beta strand repeat-containing protein [Gemmatimonadaceae bacterium]
MKKLFVIAALVAAAMAPSAVVSQELGRNQETWTWTGRVESGKWFRLSSVNGPVSVEASRDNMVHVRAEKEVRRGAVTDVAFQVVETGGDVRVCALWRRDYCDDEGHHSRRNDDDDGDRRNRSDVRVTFTISVPAGVRVSAGTVNGEMIVRNVTSDVRASTVNGRVEVANAGGEVRATTVNGAVEVTTRNGPVNASTVNGDIDVRMNSAPGDGAMKFKTVNGSVTLRMPESLDANVEMGTMHGSISSDYPVQLSGRFGPRRAQGTIGRGGRRIELETLNGSVSLKKER